MNNKYLKTIEARYEEIENFLEYLYKGKVIGKSALNKINEGIKDIPALITEVKWLRKESNARHNAIKKLVNQNKRILSRSIDKSQQIEMFKKAFELACRTACGESKNHMSDWDMIGCPPNAKSYNCTKGNSNRCHECWEKYFIQQVQE
jgi:hypothetical protein